MGTPWFAVPSLKALVEAGFDIMEVVTRPEKPVGRGRIAAPTPVKQCALELGLKVSEPASIGDRGFIKRIASLAPDLIVVVAYGKILPLEVLRIPRMGCVNLHASVLPSYRGAAPINRAIMNGDKKTGVSTMLMDSGMDTGPVLLKEEAGIGPDETAGELSERLSVSGAGVLVKTLKLLFDGKITPKPQDNARATYAPALKKEEGRIDWNLSPDEIRNRIRGLSPWPGAYTHLNGRLVKIHGGEALSDFRGISEKRDVKPGGVVFAADDGIVVKCGKGVFKITELQPESKRRMSAAQYLRGHRLGEESGFA
ncbi:MAG: methionyl-tRNA formyltransferase [Deltaproteobacteria bacterium]|nr:methionyl-tRNA formyltransferase [Deltaproteobacteria bacterium]